MDTIKAADAIAGDAAGRFGCACLGGTDRALLRPPSQELLSRCACLGRAMTKDLGFNPKNAFAHGNSI